MRHSATVEDGQPEHRPWTRVGAYAVARHQGRLLLCRIAAGYPAPGRWTLPGGGVDFGEHPDAGVIRELREETGLTGRVVGPVAVVSMSIERPTSRPGPLHAVAILYDVEVDVAPLVVEEDGGSTEACAWLEPRVAAEVAHTGLVGRALEWLGSPGRVAGSGAEDERIRVPEVGRATTVGHVAPLEAGDPVVAARAVRRALADGGRRASEVAIVVVAGPDAVADDRLRGFARRALGPAGATVHVVGIVSSAGDAASCVGTAASVARPALRAYGAHPGAVAVAVGVDRAGTTVAACLSSTTPA